MYKLHFFYILFCLWMCKSAFAQNTSNLKTSVNDFYIEKVYVHTDRSMFLTGEDIWFKVYLLNGFTNQLTVHSGVVYVDLVSSEQLDHKIIRMENGLGHGDFKIPQNIPTGKYYLRAYTNWMLNFSADFAFQKEIFIQNLKTGTQSSTLSKIQDQVDIQFFPESGSLLEDAYSVVGFKAIDVNGKGVDVKGYISNSAGDSVCAFQSSHLGLGSFNLLPKTNTTYTAHGISSKGIRFTAKLPKIQKLGYILKAGNLDSLNFRVTIKTNQATIDSGLTTVRIKGSSHGTLCASSQVKIRSLINNYKFPKKDFPNGIVSFTLFDSLNRPYCERLTYKSNVDPVYIKISPSTEASRPKTPITINIEVKDAKGNPVRAALSLSAVDRNLLKDTAKYRRTISSYINLESEIKGFIEEPERYFDTTNRQRNKELDLLLLTQGWRNFLWKSANDSAFVQKYFAEKGLTISGNLRRLLINVPLKKSNVTMAIMGSGSPYLDLTQTDTTGKYIFRDIDFSGKRKIILSSTTKNNNAKGMISLDSLFKNIPIQYQKEKPVAQLDSFVTTAFYEEAKVREQALRKYKLTDTIELNSITVKSAKKQQPTDDGNFRIYGEPDYSFKIEDKDLSAPDIFYFLRGRVAGLQIKGMYPNISISIRNGGFSSDGTPLFLLDGFPVDLDMIVAISMSSIDKIEVLKNNTSMFGSRGGNGVISIFTKKGDMGGAKEIFHAINTSIDGFYKARTFYSPRYANPENTTGMPDFRSTLHWEPNIVTDENGKANVTFFNSDKECTVSLNVEGISEQGVPLNALKTYRVKNGN